MLGTEQNNCDQQGFAYRESQSISAANQKGDRSFLVSWLFLIGSLIFTCDSLLEAIEGVTLHSIFHLLASVLFSIGSVLFIPSRQESSNLH